jgi:hypothetical protein
VWRERHRKEGSKWRNPRSGKRFINAVRDFMRSQQNNSRFSSKLRARAFLQTAAASG